MNQNVISNIVARGGDAGWDHIGEGDSLQRDFEFLSFEQADAFVQAVGARANLMDHHPEWKVGNGGRTVHVTLTSHDAGNKVTRLDFELAEICNEEFAKTLSTFKIFPRFSTQEWATFRIGLFFFCSSVFLFKILTGPEYPVYAQSYKPTWTTVNNAIYVADADKRPLIFAAEKEQIVEDNLYEHSLRHVVIKRQLL